MAKEQFAAKMFDMCIRAEEYYHHVENDGSYFTVRTKDTLYLLLEWSNGLTDWKNNFAFAAKPYKDMPKTWRAHRGFVKVWKSIEPYVAAEIADETVKSIVVVGYSHGAALAVLAHEYIWYNRPDIRSNCLTFAFEAPRVFCGVRIPEALRERWSNLYVFRVKNDIVTHVPPRLFGYKHVGNFVHVIPQDDGWTKHSMFDFINAHHPDNVQFALDCTMPKFSPKEPGSEWQKQVWRSENKRK